MPEYVKNVAVENEDDIAAELDVETEPMNVDEDGNTFETVETSAGDVRVITKKSKTTRERATALVDPTVMQRLRNAAYWTRDTVQSIVESAIVEKVEALEKDNDGAFEPIPDNRKLRTGRRGS